MSKLGFRIPSDWKVYKLSDIAEVQTGIAKNASNEFIDPIELPYLRVANVQFGYLDLSQIKIIKIEREKLPKYLLQYGDVLLTEGGDADKLGRGTIWQGEISECLHQNHVFAVRPNPRKILSKYLGWLTESTLGRKYFQLASKQTTNLASINSTQLKNFVIAIPSIAEQQSIINIISTLENAIALTEKLITAKRRLKQGLMQKLLTGKVRFPDFSTQEWINLKLKNILLSRDEKVTISDDYELYSLTIENGITPKTDRYDRSALVKDENLKKYKVVHRGDIVFNPANLRWGAIAISRVNKQVLVSPIYEVLYVKEHKKLDQEYIFQYLSSPRQIKVFASKTEGTLVERMSVKLSVFLGFDIRVPKNISEQIKISNLLMLIDQEILQLEKQSRLFQTQKQGLMQQLLTGKIRIQTP